MQTKNPALYPFQNYWGMRSCYEVVEGFEAFPTLLKNANLQVVVNNTQLKENVLRQKLRSLFRHHKVHPITIVVSKQGEETWNLYVNGLWSEQILTLMHVNLEAMDPSFWALPIQKPTLFLRDFERRFGRKPLEKQFVRAFSAWHQTLVKQATGLEKASKEEKNAFALDILLRLLFLAFLQERKMLDKRPHFIMQEASKTLFQGQSVYRDFLIPLFFETLNRAPAKRQNAYRAWGHIPFLNGGLFQPSPIETMYTAIDIPNKPLMQILDAMMTQYQYGKSDNPEGASCLDPMMLGHVYESLMCKILRAQTGSFYTPQPLVETLSREALWNYLQKKHEDIHPEYLRMLCYQHKAKNLSAEQKRKLDQTLEHIKILDPSVGSASFLAFAFHQLIAMRQVLNPADKTTRAKSILAHNLYGVDIMQQAIKIGELRLWLTHLQALDPNGEVEPLINLDLRIRCGHALLENGIPVPDALPSKIVESLHNLRAQYIEASGPEKYAIIDAMVAHERKLARYQLLVQCQRIEKKIEEAQKQEKSTLFPSDNADLKTKELIKTWDKERSALQHSLKALDAGLAPRFSFHTHFSEIMAQGGFDLILGNPPWLPMHKLPRAERESIQALYETARTAKASKFGGQAVDLAAPFVEKSLQLLNNDGVLAMILPHKLLNAPSYVRFRRYVERHGALLAVKDWSQIGEAYFDAANYPASLIIGRREPGVGKTTFNWGQKAEKACEVSQAKHWGAPTVGNLFNVKRGLFTGKNALFIPRTITDCGGGIVEAEFTNGEKAELELSMLEPLVKGADISAYHVRCKQYLLFPHRKEPQAPIIENLPPLTAAWFSKHEASLKARSGIRSNQPYYGLFRCYDELFKPRVVWRDLSYALEAAFLPAEGPLLLNTVYYASVPDADSGYLLSAYLNAEPIRAYCRKHAERALGDYRRYFAWLIRDLPWPFLGSATERLVELSKTLHRDRNNAEAKAAIDTLVREALLQWQQG